MMGEEVVKYCFEFRDVIYRQPLVLKQLYFRSKLGLCFRKVTDRIMPRSKSVYAVNNASGLVKPFFFLIDSF